MSHHDSEVNDDLVCSNCVSDNDLKAWMSDASTGTCTYCGNSDVPAVPFDTFIDHIRETIFKYFDNAVNNLGHDKESPTGYSGSTYDTSDVLDSFCLDFPLDDDNQLREAIWHAFEDDEPWCDRDWTILPLGPALGTSWERLSETIKHERRFYFRHYENGEEVDEDDHDTWSPDELLRYVAKWCQSRDLVKSQATGTLFYRARADDGKGPYLTGEALGPPPPHKALQSNRMNPPGISMMYAGDSKACAAAEIQSERPFYLGTFSTTREIRLLDLSKLPPVRGIFSGIDRDEREGALFVQAFVDSIMQPVARDERAHLDYLPSQVVTEFLRHYPFDEGGIDGITYRSVAFPTGTNTVLFAEPSSIITHSPTPRWSAQPWLRLDQSELFAAPIRGDVKQTYTPHS